MIGTEQQPAPIANERPAVWPLVIADMQARNEFGIQHYGTPLQPFNGRDALVDAYHEALDLCVYLRQEIEQRSTGTSDAIRRQCADEGGKAMSASFQRFQSAAIEFCKRQIAVAEFRGALTRCEFAESGDPSIGDGGIAECRYSNIPEDEYCDPCKVRAKNMNLYKIALRARGNAKSRMMRAFRKLDLATAVAQPAGRMTDAER